MKFFLYIKLIAVILLSAIGPYFAFINYKPLNETSYFYVNEGASIRTTLNNLKPITTFDKIYLNIYMKLNDIDTLKVGKYEIKNLNLKDVFIKLSNGQTVIHKLIIRDGSNIYQINDELNNSYLNNDCINLDCIENKFPFKEGVLYPDTYFYKDLSDASLILQESHDRLYKSINEIWKLKPSNNPLKNINEAIILASIIEKEAGNMDEKKDIAAVFLKRLTLGMRLQADPTIIYGLLPNFDGDIKKSDILNKNNLYNTYMQNGLPPSPIAMSSISSIEAAITSAPGDYLYFVADSKTSHYFSKTYQEHLDMIKKLGLN